MNKIRKSFSVNKQPEKTYDYLAKIVIIGNSAVGKTNVLLRFINQNYSMAHTPTIGVDFKSKIIETQSTSKKKKTKIKLQLWDTAGQQRFRTLTDTYYNGASGIAIVYSIDDKKSFNDVKEWIYQLNQNKSQHLPKIIIGNKCDLREDRKVKYQEGRMLADEYKCPFMEVSAKENINVEQIFMQLAMIIEKKLQESEQEQKIDRNQLQKEKQFNKSNVMLNNPTPKKQECCK